MTKLSKKERIKMYEQLTIKLDVLQDDYLEYRDEDYFCEDKNKQKYYEEFAEKEQELYDKIDKLGVKAKSRYEYDPIKDLKIKVGKAADWSKTDEVLQEMRKGRIFTEQKKVIPLNSENYNNPNNYIEMRKAKMSEYKKEVENNFDWSEENIKNLIKNNDYMVCICIVRIYEENQTYDEQADGVTKHYNGIGFNAYDSGFLSSLAEQFKSKDYLSEKQIAVGRKAIIKYVKQLESINII
jgi:hypothetical protein